MVIFSRNLGNKSVKLSHLWRKRSTRGIKTKRKIIISIIMLRRKKQSRVKLEG